MDPGQPQRSTGLGESSQRFHIIFYKLCDPKRCTCNICMKHRERCVGCSIFFNEREARIQKAKRLQREYLHKYRRQWIQSRTEAQSRRTRLWKVSRAFHRLLAFVNRTRLTVDQNYSTKLYLCFALPVRRKAHKILVFEMKILFLDFRLIYDIQNSQTRVYSVF